MNTESVLLVRLKAYDPRRGHVLRCFSYLNQKYIQSGWYSVHADVGEYLRGVRQLTHDPHAALAFDVCTEEEAAKLDAKEHEDGLRRSALRAQTVEPRQRADAKANEPRMSEAKNQAKAEARAEPKKDR